MDRTIIFSFATVVLLLAAVASAFSQSRKNVSYDGVTYQVVTQAKDFLLAYKNGEPAALMFKINDYQKTMFSVRDEGAKLGIDITKAFVPATIVRASTLELYSMMEAFTVLQGGTVSPNVDAYVFNTVRPSTGQVSREDSAKNLKAYFRYLAGLWWPLRDRNDRTSSQSKTPGARICDWCFKDVLYGEGYIYGFYSSGNLATHRLWCEDCMDKRLDDYRSNGLTSEGGFFEAEDVRRANEYAQGKR